MIPIEPETLRRPRKKTPRRTHEIGTYAWLRSTFAREAGVTEAAAEKLITLLLEIVKDTTWDRGRLVIPGFASFRVKRRKVPRAGPNVEPLPTYRERDVVQVRATKNWRTK